MKKYFWQLCGRFFRPAGIIYAAVFSWLAVLYMWMPLSRGITPMPKLMGDGRLYVFLLFFAALFLLLGLAFIFERRLKPTSVIHRVIHSPLLPVMLIVVGFRMWYYPHFQQYMTFYDTISYTEYTGDIFAGRPELFRTPVYPYFIKLIQHFTADVTAKGGEELLYTNIVRVQQIISLVAVVLFYFAVCKIVKNRYIRAAATLLFGCAPTVIAWNICILTETLAISSAVLLLFLMLSYLKKPNMAKAIIIGLYCLYMVMLRPTFVYLYAVVAVFFVFRFIFYKLDRKQCVAGALALALSGGLLLGYCGANYRLYGYFGVSDVGTNLNQLYMVIDRRIYKNTDNPELTEYVGGRINAGYETHAIKAAVYDEFAPADVRDYVNGCIKQHLKEYSEYTLSKFAGLLAKGMSTSYCPPNSGDFDMTENNLLGLTYPFRYGDMWIAAGAALILTAVVAARKKRCLYPVLGLAALLVSHELVSIYGSMEEFERLSVIAAPMLLMLTAYLIDIFCTAVSGRRLWRRIETECGDIPFAENAAPDAASDTSAEPAENTANDNSAEPAEITANDVQGGENSPAAEDAPGAAE